MGQRKNTGAFPRVWLTPGHSEYREERAKRKKRREQGKKSLIMQWRKEGNKMSLCWMPPWNSHLTLMSQIGVALIRQEKQTHAYTHTHTPVQITQTNWVYFFYVVGRAPKCVIIRKWGKKKHFFGLFLTAHAAHVNKKTSASYPAAQSSLHFVSQTFPFVGFFFAGACIRNHDTFPFD